MFEDAKRAKIFERIFLLSVFAILLLSRFLWLAEKPFHHDESQYASFSLYLFRGSPYIYDPILHGPFLFYLNKIIYTLFGVSDFTARLGVALLGCVVPLCLIGFRRFIGALPAFLVVLFYVVSPSFTYYNRFLAHDTYVTLFSVMFIYYFARHILEGSVRFIYLASLSLCLLFTVKISSYIYAFIFLSFLIIMLVSRFDAAIEEKKKRYLTLLKSQIPHIAAASVIFFAIYALLYSSFFKNPSGFLDGLFLKSIRYWAGQNAVQRIRGAFDYHLPIIATYELPVLLISFAGIIYSIFKGRKRALTTLVFVAANVVLFFIVRHFWNSTLKSTDYSIPKFFDYVLHMQRPYQLPMTLVGIYAGYVCIREKLNRSEIFEAFVLYWLFFSAIIYSYAGEKVPWLSLNIVLPMFFYASILAGKFYRRHFVSYPQALKLIILIIVSVSIYFTLYINYRVSIKNPADPRERLVFVQTAPEMKMAASEIVSISKKTGEGRDMCIAVHGEAGWPLNWYLRDFKTIHPPPAIDDLRNKSIVFDLKDAKSRQYLDESFESKKVKLREWWVPDMTKKVGPKEFLDYYLYRKTWSVIGYIKVVVLTRKDLLSPSKQKTIIDD